MPNSKTKVELHTDASIAQNRLLCAVLVKLKKAFEMKKIHYSQMTSWNRQFGEGYNDGVDECIKIVDRRIKKLKNGA